jgi:phage protein U
MTLPSARHTRLSAKQSGKEKQGKAKEKDNKIQLKRCGRQFLWQK